MRGVSDSGPRNSLRDMLLLLREDRELDKLTKQDYLYMLASL